MKGRSAAPAASGKGATEPRGREARGGDGRTALSRESVIEAALAIADGEGLDALTVRRLASELGAAPMALYRYFRNKEELVTGLFDHVIAAYDPAEHGHEDWKQELRSSFRWFRSALMSHPGIMPVLTRRVGVRHNTDRITESVLSALRRVTRNDQEASRAFFSLVSFTVGFTALETAATEQRRAAGIDDEQEWLRLSRLQFEAMPSGEYPSLVALAAHIGEYWTDPQFEDGLGRLLDSIALA